VQLSIEPIIDILLYMISIFQIELLILGEYLFNVSELLIRSKKYLSFQLHVRKINKVFGGTSFLVDDFESSGGYFENSCYERLFYRTEEFNIKVT